VQKLFGFLAPDSHYGKSMNKEDTEELEISVISPFVLNSY
jgi:hypothetical protein